MIRYIRIITIIILPAILIAANYSAAGDLGLFKTIPVETPGRGILRMSNTSFYSDIESNNILSRKYGIKDSRIFSSITEFELGITKSLNFNGSLPYYADLFKQGSKKGKKTGAGDIVLGLRLSHGFDDTMFKGFSFGGRIRIPEQLGYGPEPLGFRTFSYGKLAYSIETSTGFRFKFMDCNISVSMLQFPNAAKTDSAFTTDTFYETGFGYMGIGRPDNSGLAEGIFQNQLNVSFGTAIRIKSWFAGILEVNSTSFIKKPKREKIMSIAPGFRIGSAEGFNLSAGMDYALSGSIPDKTFMFRFRIPTLSARGIKELLIKKRVGEEVRSRYSLVAIKDFSKSDFTYLYEKDLKNTLQNNLSDRGLMSIVPGERVRRAFQQKALVPLPDKPHQLGVRLGANYLINAEILDYNVNRSSGFKVPLLISFPETNFSLSVRASVTDLVTGEMHTLGIISTRVVKSRGVNFFPIGASSDIEFMSEPERRVYEKELIYRWVEEFNNVLIDKIEIFGWEPKQTEIIGDEEVSG